MENKSKSDFNFWFLAGLCFVAAGFLGHRLGLIVLGLAFVCIGFLNRKESEEDKKDKEK